MVHSTIETIEIVSNGAPLDDVALQVRDGHGRPLPPGLQGTLWVRGPSVAAGYLGNVDPERFEQGWYDTGDQGFLWDREQKRSIWEAAHKRTVARLVEMGLWPARVPLPEPL